MIKKCKVCRIPFKTYPCRLTGKGGHKALFCSKGCANKYNQNGKETRFKKGHISASKLHPEIMPSANNHFAWKGNNVSYRGLHYWVIRQKGYAHTCINCGKQSSNHKMIQWANIDHNYRRVLEDYISLCSSCHKNYDIKNNL